MNGTYVYLTTIYGKATPLQIIIIIINFEIFMYCLERVKGLECYNINIGINNHEGNMIFIIKSYL